MGTDPGGVWSGENTQAPSFEVVVAIWKPIALVLSTRFCAPAIVVREVPAYCLRDQRLAQARQEMIYCGIRVEPWRGCGGRCRFTLQLKRFVTAITADRLSQAV